MTTKIRNPFLLIEVALFFGAIAAATTYFGVGGTFGLVFGVVWCGVAGFAGWAAQDIYRDL